MFCGTVVPWKCFGGGMEGQKGPKPHGTPQMSLQACPDTAYAFPLKLTSGTSENYHFCGYGVAEYQLFHETQIVY